MNNVSFSGIDWLVVAVYFVIVMTAGLIFTRRASGSTDDFFLAGRSLPWWLAGTSLVATFFAADTPLFHAANVRRYGMDAGWLFFLPGILGLMATVLFARLWRRSRVMTEVELFEIRYSGNAASVFRGVNAVYGIFKSIVILGWVILAMGVFLEKLFGVDKTIGSAVCILFAMTYSVSSGIWGVVAADFVQYFIATFGTIYLAVLAVIKCGGLAAMNAKIQALDWTGATMRVLPDPTAWDPRFSWWLFIGWFLVFGVELGTAGGFIGQRIYATKDEKNASNSVLWFVFCYYVLNGWPWILTGLTSLIVLGSTDAAAGLSDPQEVYPAMINTLMPVGLKGLMGAAMIAAFMSTISAITTWGSSYAVNDVYRRFVHKDASKKHYVWVSRLASLLILLLAGYLSTKFDNITHMLTKVFLYLCGGYMVFLCRWLWHRTNITSEIVAIAASLVVGLYVDQFMGTPLREGAPEWLRLLGGGIWASDEYFEFQGQKLLAIISGTTAIWLLATFLTKPTDNETLMKFYRMAVIPGPGWNRIRKQCGNDCRNPGSVWKIVIAWAFGVIGLYGILIAIGYAIKLEWIKVISILLLSIASVWGYFKLSSTLPHYEEPDE